tara:strand:+ start:5837 stop:6286 length:450 start_codon:yes stop_codon:yes gene_type:complete
MTKIFLVTTFLLFSFFAQSQSKKDFDEMKRKEIRHILLSQQTSELALKYAQKHRQTRIWANGFLIGSGVIALSGVIFHHTNTYEEDTWGELGHGLYLVGFMWGTGLTIVTSGILHLISENHLQKAKGFYLSSQRIGNSTSLELGIKIRF